MLAVAAAGGVLTAMGFTWTGIAEAWTVAKMMSATALSNKGGVAAGSTVAAIQSAGVDGVSTSSNMILYANGEPVAVLL